MELLYTAPRNTGRHFLSFVLFCFISTFITTTTVFCGAVLGVGVGVTKNLCHLSFFGKIKNNKISNPSDAADKTNLVRKMNTIKNNSTSTTCLNTTKEDDDDDDDDTVIGGGDINEKERQYRRREAQPQPLSSSSSSSSSSTYNKDTNGIDDKEMKQKSAYNASQQRSHLIHAIEGLDRYPNYLSRWNEPDIESLEEALEERLEQVKQQKFNISNQRKHIQSVLEEFLLEYPEWKDFVREPCCWDDVRNLLDPRAVNAIFRSKIFHKKNDDQNLRSNNDISVNDVISGRIRIPIELDTEYLQEWIEYEMDDVYSFPLLSETFCSKLHTFVSSIMSFVETTPRISNFPVRIYKDLDYLGLEWLNDLIFNLILRPISAQLYKETELSGGDLDWRTGYIASYSGDPTSSKPRQRLVPHTDDAEVSTIFLI